MGEKIITVDIARQKLGKRGEGLTDKQINDILTMLRFICNKVIDSTLEVKTYAS